MSIETDVVVVGGGATGCGVARDLAMRGVDVTLLERGSLNAGTTGRSHGLLHSGARYADVDPESAGVCRSENRVLRRIAGACVEDTGGYLLQLSADDDAYFERKLDACRNCDIETRVLDGDALRALEPGLSTDVVRAIGIPDAVVYPSRLVAATAESARIHGATVLTGATVTGIRVAETVTVEIRREATSHPTPATETITSNHLVNAAGAWAGRVAALAGIDVSMAPTRGDMVVLENVGLDAVLNRCRPPADGDIVVPHAETVVCGTTSVPIEGPDDPATGRDDTTETLGAGERGERIRTLVAEAAAMVPEIADARQVRTFWGVRPLYDLGGREATRGVRLLDHDDRDGLPSVSTVVGGKLTTYRRMAEVAADHVARRLGVDEPGRTAEEPLPGHDDPQRLDELVREFEACGPADMDVVDGRADVGREP